MPDIFDSMDGEILPRFTADYKANQTFLVELTTDSCLCLATALHLYMTAHPNSEMAKKALYELMDQTDVVSGNSRNHGVHPSVLTSPAEARVFPQIAYIPVD